LRCHPLNTIGNTLDCDRRGQNVLDEIPKLAVLQGEIHGKQQEYVGDNQNLETAEIVDWNWSSDPDFGSNGAIKWNVQVRNKSAKPMSLVKVEFTTYDKAGKLIASDFTYVQAIPAGQSRSDESYADYHGTEDEAGVQVAEVTFAH
jgi:hypothetical protein